MVVVQAWVTLVKDIVTGLAAMVATVLAIRGFNTWKEQLTTQKEYDLARRLLVNIYEYRNALTTALGSISHMEEKELSDRMSSILIEYQNEKFNELDRADAKLQTDILEAKAVWGDNVLFKLNIITLTDYKSTLELMREGIHIMGEISYGKELKEDTPKNVDILTPDNFHKGLYKVVTELENYLRPKLTLKQTKARSWDFRIRRKR